MKIINSLFLVAAFSIFAAAQTYEFPDGLIADDRLPEAGSARGLRSIIYTRQKGASVFETSAETFDADGRKTEFLTQNAGVDNRSDKPFRIGQKSIYVYDARGRLGKIVARQIQGAALYTKVFNYDANNLLIGATGYDAAGRKTDETKFKRAAGKRTVEVITIAYLGGNGFLTKFTLDFNDKNQCVKRVQYGANAPILIDSFEFNDKGLIAKYSRVGFGFAYDYKYDGKGNWTERQTAYFSKSGGAQNDIYMSEYRVISYYEDREKEPANIIVKTAKPKK